MASWARRATPTASSTAAAAAIPRPTWGRVGMGIDATASCHPLRRLAALDCRREACAFQASGPGADCSHRLTADQPAATRTLLLDHSCAVASVLTAGATTPE